MKTQKKVKLKAIKFSDDELKVIETVAARYGLGKNWFSRYIRGCILVQMRISGQSISGLDVPGWVTKAHGEIFKCQDVSPCTVSAAGKGIHNKNI